MIHVNNGRGDPWSGNNLARIRERASDSLGVHINQGRFCESCQKLKPRRGQAFKGWKCDDCKK